MAEIQTKIINNFRGNLTRIRNGDMNSGLARYDTSFGYIPYDQPYNLQWYEAPTQIDSAGSVVTDLILKFIVRVESGTPFVYAIGYSGRFYKITVSTDSPALTSATGLGLSFGGGMEFYQGSSEKVWIGHNTGVVKMGFDGSSQTNITGPTWISNVPRTFVQFLGKLYASNDTNLVEIDSTEAVTSNAKLNPTIPSNFHIVDLSITPDGRYIAILATRNTPLDVQTLNPSDIGTNQESAIFYWNGVDAGITSYDIIPSFIMTALNVSSPYFYIFGYDLASAIVRNQNDKILSNLSCKSPRSSSIDYNGNIVGWCAPESNSGNLKASQFVYGTLDAEFPGGWFRLFRMSASGSNTDVMVVGANKIITNLTFQSASAVPLLTSRLYFSTYETGGTATAKLYKFTLTPPAGGNSIAGVYETQTELFSKTVIAKAVRFYFEPAVSGNGFQMDLIGSDGSVMSGTAKTYTFAAGGDITQNQGAIDMIEFTNFEMSPTYALGLRITNTGTTNMIFFKAEIDYAESGR